jgi:very-short-patch-repair endonuclease
MSRKKKSKAHQRAAKIGVEKRKAAGTWIAHQRYARSRLPHEAVMRGSKKGALKVVQKYGAQALMKFAREWRLEHPSRPEQALLIILDRLGYKETTRYEDGTPRDNGLEYFIREDPCGPYLLDTYFPVLRCAIEIDGKPAEWMDDQRLEFEIRRRREITAHGISFLSLRNETRSEMKKKIKDFLLGCDEHLDAPKVVADALDKICAAHLAPWPCPERFWSGDCKPISKSDHEVMVLYQPDQDEDMPF